MDTNTLMELLTHPELAEQLLAIMEGPEEVVEEAIATQLRRTFENKRSLMEEMIAALEARDSDMWTELANHDNEAAQKMDKLLTVLVLRYVDGEVAVEKLIGFMRKLCDE